MSCVAGCVCACGQTACGCHETKRTIRGTTRQQVCPACGTILVTRDQASVGGAPVRVALCPRCDLKHH